MGILLREFRYSLNPLSLPSLSSLFDTIHIIYALISRLNLVQIKHLSSTLDFGFEIQFGKIKTASFYSIAPLPSLPDLFSLFTLSLSSLSIVWIKPRSCVSNESCDSPSISLTHTLLLLPPSLSISFFSLFSFLILLLVASSLSSFLAPGIFVMS